jgi:hypothetical protein
VLAGRAQSGVGCLPRYSRVVEHEQQARPEQEIFEELTALCASSGYAHAIAYFSCRDNNVFYDGEISAEDMDHLYSHDSLIRTEISTLIGLLVKGPKDLTLPSPEAFSEYVAKSESLLNELHQALTGLMFAGLGPASAAAGPSSPLSKGAALREPIFYGGDSAYSFQYRDFAPSKYAKDADWLRAKKGFSIDDAQQVVTAIADVQARQLRETLIAIQEKAPHERTLLPAFTFTISAVAESARIDADLTERVLAAFSIPRASRNDSFKSLSDFNITNACPLIAIGTGTFVLFQYYSLVEALYEAPFYWMLEDPSYVSTASIHRGEFTESLSAQRLEFVFGKENVHSNVKIVGRNGKTLGEIDVLVIFGDRAIVLQAKSKRLTQEARKGNDLRIKEDFTKSVQDAYDQGNECAGLLLDGSHEYRDGRARELRLPKTLREIYPVCVVADHYPALAFQVQEFLTYKAAGAVQPPLVLDVFALDAITEMLSSPLHLLSYIKRRVGYTEKVLAGHELTILSYHLKQNLWIDKDLASVAFGDDIATELDIAMNARRDHLPGQTTPDGILTRLRATTLGRIIESIETTPNPATLSLGFELLALSEDAALQASAYIDTIVNLARRDGRHHDFAARIANGWGIAIHCNDDPLDLASRRLHYHCQRRKYLERANAWFGICLSPWDGAVRFGINLEYPWRSDPDLEAKISSVDRSARSVTTKVGRNDPCICGSGRKYKKCCLQD